MTWLDRHSRRFSGDGDPIGAAHDEIVGEPIRLDTESGGAAYVIRTVVDSEGSYTVEYADPDEAEA